MVLLPHRAHPVTSNRDTIRTAISVASNATHRRDPIHKMTTPDKIELL